MEIERKYLIEDVPENLTEYDFKKIEQGYLCTAPVVRIRRANDDYFLTYKGSGLMVREEHNLALTKESYEHLKTKIDGILIEKRRYLIPFTGNLTIELDIFEGKLTGLILAEVEFENEDDANSFTPPEWFGEDVTYSSDYHNNILSQKGLS